jgi:hypothetical protein
MKLSIKSTKQISQRTTNPLTFWPPEQRTQIYLEAVANIEPPIDAQFVD